MANDGYRYFLVFTACGRFSKQQLFLFFKLVNRSRGRQAPAKQARLRNNDFFFLLQRTEPRVLTLFVQYNSVICHPSDHTVGRPRA